MHSRIHARLSRQIAALALAAAALTGCSLESQKAPSLTGPSEFGLSVTMVATPDVLPRDGTSQSVVTITARDAQNKAISGQRIALAASVGRLSQTEVVTNAEGKATFSFVAPNSSEAAPGNIAVIQALPVAGNVDNAAVRSISILLTGVSNTSAPTASFTFSPATPAMQDAVVFDASASRDEGVVCGDNCSYTWDFGGEAVMSGRIVTYRFLATRTYPVKLTVIDSAGSSGSVTQNVVVAQGAAPTASFSFSPSSPGQFEPVNFTAEASRVGVTGRSIVSYQWRFGDGSTASGVAVSHSYNVLGTYPVTLTVTDSAGVQGTVTNNVVIVNGVTAEFTISPSPSATGRETFFDPEASRGSDNGFGGRNPIVQYIWSFGDSTTLTTTTDRVVSHIYNAAGIYTINLTVVDSLGRRQTVNHTLTVN